MVAEIVQEIEVLIRKIHKIKINLKKAPSKKYLRSTIVQKINKVKEINGNIIEKLHTHKNDLSIDQFGYLIKSTKLEYSECDQMLKSKLDSHSKLLSFKSVGYAIIFCNNLIKFRNNQQDNRIKMVFDMKTATSYKHTTWNIRKFRCIYRCSKLI